MVITPHILGQVKRKFFSADATLGCESPFEVSPEPFQPVDVVSLAIAVLTLLVLHQAMNITLGRYPRVTLPGVRANRRSRLNLSGDQG